MNEKEAKRILFFSQTGCFLPFLIIFNFFFGWIFFRPLIWLLIELVLIAAFLVNVFLLKRNILRMNIPKQSVDSDVVDIEAEVEDEDKKNPRRIEG